MVAKICTSVQLPLFFRLTIMLGISAFFLDREPSCGVGKSYGNCPPTGSLGVAGLSRRKPQFGRGNLGWGTRDLRPTTKQDHAEPARAAGGSLRELPHGGGLASDPRGAGV